jgi:energy-coupling factor transport system ATP-binding protein
MLDPLGKEQVFEILESLKSQEALTLIVVEHNVEQVAPMSDKVALIVGGKLVRFLPPDDAFGDLELLDRYGIAPPQITAFACQLRDEGLYRSRLPLTVGQALVPLRELLTREREHD